MSDTPETDGREPLANPKWERFADLVAGGQDFGEAYEMAGFTADRDNARKFMKREEINRRIQYLIRFKSERDTGIPMEEPLPDASRAYVMKSLIENAEIALGHRKVKMIIVKRKSGKSNLPSVHEFDVTDRHGMTANKALELLGKELGMWGDKPKEAPEDRENLDKRGVFDDERLIALFGPRPPTKDAVK